MIRCFLVTSGMLTVELVVFAVLEGRCNSRRCLPWTRVGASCVPFDVLT